MASIRDIMWEAVTSKVGVEVATSDVEAFKRKFYSERAKAREEGCFEFDVLAVVMPPPTVTGKIWVVQNV